MAVLFPTMISSTARSSSSYDRLLLRQATQPLSPAPMMVLGSTTVTVLSARADSGAKGTLTTRPTLPVRSPARRTHLPLHLVSSPETCLIGHPYSIDNILGPLSNEYSDLFVGGDVLQSYLSGTDYHRFHAPISGMVTRIELVHGLTFSETETEGFDPNGVRKSVGYEAHVNTRLLMMIDSGDSALGTVCYVPIGMGQVSSIRMTVVEGQYINKGDEVGWFSYGGSSIVLIFQPNVIQKVHVKTDDVIQARQRIATVRHDGGGIHKDDGDQDDKHAHDRKTEL